MFSLLIITHAGSYLVNLLIEAYYNCWKIQSLLNCSKTSSFWHFSYRFELPEIPRLFYKDIIKVYLYMKPLCYH